MTDLYRLLPGEMDELMAKLEQPRYRADQVLRALYHEAPSCIADIRQLPSALRAWLEEEGYFIGSATEVRRVTSEDGLTTKLLLQMEGGTLLETVVMQYPSNDGGHPRSTVCVSTQAGCAMGCVFCATGQMGFERNLRAEELVAQVVHLARTLRARGEHVTNIVFMGMGEPLANYAETIRAVRLLTDAQVVFAPGKAANAGGVATSCLEMAQNAGHISWTRAEVDGRLHEIMKNIHRTCVEFGKDGDYVNYVNGANRAGFNSSSTATSSGK